MSSTAETIQPKAGAVSAGSISLWMRQIAAIMRLELKKNFFGKRSFLIYLLALMPIGLLLLVAVVQPAANEWSDFASLPKIFSVIFNGMILRTVVFFGCAWIFMNLFRGEIVDRSLHYYFLSSVRRDVLIAGKYFSGLVTSIILFTGLTIVSMLLFFFPHFYSASMRFFLDGPGLSQLST